MNKKFRKQICILLCLFLTCMDLYVGNGSQVYAQGQGEAAKGESSDASPFAPYDQVYVFDDTNIKGTVYEGKDFCQIEYSEGWTGENGGGGLGCYNNTDHWADSGATCTITFVGTNLKFYSRTASHLGSSVFSLDNKEPVSVNFWSSKQTDNVFLYDTGILEYGEHCLTIQAGALIVVDRVEVSCPYAIVNDSEEGTGELQVKYDGTWTYEGSEKPQGCEHKHDVKTKDASYGKDVHWAENTGSFEIKFSGTSVKYYTESGNGQINVSLDGESVADGLLLNSGTPNQGLAFDSKNYKELAPGLHTLNVEIAGGVVVADRLEVCCTHNGEEQILKNKKEATCTEEGYTGDTCYKNCGQEISKGETIPVKAHSWNEGEVTEQPTQDKDGIKTYTCTVCGATRTEIVSFSCSHENKEERHEEATCTKPGYKEAFYCPSCDKMISDGIEIPALGHDLQVRDFKEAGTTEDGYTGDTYCTRCDYVEAGEVIPKAYAVVNNAVTGTKELEYNFTDGWTYEKADSSADCYEGDNHWSDTANAAFEFKFNGTSVKYCGQKGPNLGYAAFSVDGGEEEEVNLYNASKVDQVLIYKTKDLQPGLHTLKVRVTGKNGGGNSCVVVADRIEVYCNHKGEETESCDTEATCTEPKRTGDSYGKVCGQKVSEGKEVGEPLGHEIKNKEDKAATCTEPGYTGQTYCTRCDMVIGQGEKIEALGHAWDDGVITKQPTDTEEGIRLYTCTRTDCKETKTLTVPATGGVGSCSHGNTEKKNQAATCTKPGYRDAVYCRDCGKMLQEGTVILALGHNPEVKGIKEANGTEDGYTGDTYCTRCSSLLETGEVIPKAYAVINDHATGTKELEFSYVGDWREGSDTEGCYEEDSFWSETMDDYFEFKFSGTSVKYYGKRADHLGYAAFSIDGGEEEMVNLYNAVEEDQVLVYKTEELQPGTHTLKVRVTGENGAGGRHIVVADKIEVYCNHKGERRGSRNVEATCTETGSIGEVYGKVCGQKISDGKQVKAFGHLTASRDKKATCTKSGYRGQIYCIRCKEIIDHGQKLPALGHQWDNGVVTKEPTATKAGVKTFTCNVSKATKTETIPAAGIPQPQLPKVGDTLKDKTS